MEPSLLSVEPSENMREQGGQLESVLLLKSISMLPNTLPASIKRCGDLSV